MPILMDTNILLRLVDPNDPEYALVREAVRALAGRGESLCFAAQNLVEFWNVCTRPASKNGLGLTPAQTDERATLIEGKFPLANSGSCRWSGCRDLNPAPLAPQASQLQVFYSVLHVFRRQRSVNQYESSQHLSHAARLWVAIRDARMRPSGRM